MISFLLDQVHSPAELQQIQTTRVFGLLFTFKTQHNENNKIPDTTAPNERIVYPGFGSAGKQGNGTNTQRGKCAKGI